MSNHADIGLGQTERPGHFGSVAIVVKRHHDHGAFPLFQLADAARELFPVDVRQGRRWRHAQVGGILFEQPLLSLRAAAEVEHRHTAGAQDKGGEFFGLAKAAGPEGLQCGDKDLLHEIVRGVFLPQVAQAVQADPRTHAADEFGFGFAIGSSTDS